MISNTEGEQQVGVFKGHLKEMDLKVSAIKEALDKVLKQHQHDLEVELRPQLVEDTKILMKSLKSSNYSSILGSNVHKFVKEGNVENCSVFMGNTRKFLMR